MAEKAAHVSSTTHPAASVLEVSAAESLQETLHPALESFLLFFAPYNNSLLRKLIKYYNEVFLFLHFILQRHYLNNFSSTFSEQVYGLKRIGKNGKNLEKIDEKPWTFFFIVLLPYLRIKAEQQRNKYRLQLCEENLQNVYEKAVKTCASLSIGTAEVIWRFWNVIQMVHYMSGKSIHQTPELRLQDQRLVYVPSDSDRPTSLEFVAFLIQFVSSWGSDPRASSKQLPIPHPPRYDNHSVRLKGKCGICLQPWVVPTALSVSGYVFCFRCIIQHLQNGESCCPITKLPANVQHLLRLF